VSAATPASSGVRGFGPAVVTVAFLGAVIGGVGAPLITPVALDLGVSLDAAQWTLTVTLFAGAIAAPVLGRLGTGSHRRAAILITLSLVAVGGLLTTIPSPFGVLLVGRALQGLGLGVVALLMSVARDYLPAERAHATIATVSVASTVGIGVAYPLMGVVDQVAGLRIAYGSASFSPWPQSSLPGAASRRMCSGQLPGSTSWVRCFWASARSGCCWPSHNPRSGTHRG